MEGGIRKEGWEKEGGDNRKKRRVTNQGRNVGEAKMQREIMVCLCLIVFETCAHVGSCLF